MLHMFRAVLINLNTHGSSNFIDIGSKIRRVNYHTTENCEDAHKIDFRVKQY